MDRALTRPRWSRSAGWDRAGPVPATGLGPVLAARRAGCPAAARRWCPRSGHGGRAARAGAAPPRSGYRPAVRDVAAGRAQPGGPCGRPAARSSAPRPRTTTATVPPVRYGLAAGRSRPARPGRCRAGGPASDPVRGGPCSSRRGRGGLGASVILPVAGTLAALVVLVALRAADPDGGQLARRHAAAARGPFDPPLSAAMFPRCWPGRSWPLLLAPAANRGRRGRGGRDDHRRAGSPLPAGLRLRGRGHRRLLRHRPGLRQHPGGSSEVL